MINPGARNIIKEDLDGLGIPHIDAPGEAEAECCKLQTLRLVDAVWSQGSDCLMFGCTFWIRELRTARETGKNSRHIGNTQQDHKRVRVVRAENLKIGEFQLKPDGCVLFAMLVGADYDAQDLRGCGTINALTLVKASLSRSLCSRKSQEECDLRRNKVLLRFVANQSINMAVPRTWPEFEILRKYNDPNTHNEMYLRSDASLYSNYDQPPNEEKLLRTACTYFNFWKQAILQPYWSHTSISIPCRTRQDAPTGNTTWRRAGQNKEQEDQRRPRVYSTVHVNLLTTWPCHLEEQTRLCAFRKHTLLENRHQLRQRSTG